MIIDLMLTRQLAKGFKGNSADITASKQPLFALDISVIGCTNQRGLSSL